MVGARQIADVLGGRATLGRTIRTIQQLDELIGSARMPRAAVDRLATRISDRPDLKYRIVPRSSYHRAAYLSEAHAQRAERLARVFAMALEVWQDEALARRFLNTPHPELGGATAIDRAMTELGAREVEEVIDRGRYGLPV